MLHSNVCICHYPYYIIKVEDVQQMLEECGVPLNSISMMINYLKVQ